MARASETADGFPAFHLDGVGVKLHTEVTLPLVQDANVLGVLPGGDPDLARETVIISAHYDHNGRDQTGVYAGANDNASGVAGLLAVADAMGSARRLGTRPRRTILFASWGIEEIGLMGAWAYTEQPVISMADTVAVLNMDMIGREEEVPRGADARFNGLPPQGASANADAINLIGTSRSSDLAAVVERANAGIGLTLRRRYDNNASNLMRRSDHWPFLQRGVPALWFHAGLHPDYHTVDDRPERLNIDKIVRVSRLVMRAAWRLAQQDERPQFIREGTRQPM